MSTVGDDAAVRSKPREDLGLAVRRVSAKFDALQGAEIIKAADTRQFHSADQTRDSIKRSTEEILRRKDGPFARMLRRLRLFR